MTFDEALLAPGRLVQLWSSEVIDGQRIVMIYRLSVSGTEKLAWRRIPELEVAGFTATLQKRDIAIAAFDFYCNFVWISGPGTFEVFDNSGQVFAATAQTATIADGRTFARSEFVSVFSFAEADYVWRGVKAKLRSGEEVPLVTEAASSAMGDPTYSRNELLVETGWAPTIAAAIATWASAGFEDRI